MLLKPPWDATFNACNSFWNFLFNFFIAFANYLAFKYRGQDIRTTHLVMISHVKWVTLMCDRISNWREKINSNPEVFRNSSLIRSYFEHPRTGNLNRLSSFTGMVWIGIGFEISPNKPLWDRNSSLLQWWLVNGQIGYQNLKLVTKIFRLQHPSATSM